MFNPQRHYLSYHFDHYFPLSGDAERFSAHVLRIFDSDGNDYLDFKEFLLALDIATCETEESKLVWAFKLFDYDNSGCIDAGEMVAIMETLACIDGVEVRVKSEVRLEDGELEPMPTASERARDLFEALDKAGNGFLTQEQFVQVLRKMSCQFIACY